MRSGFQRGFTLIEIIMVVVLIGIAAVAIGGMQSSLFRKQADVNTLQVQSRLQAECAEQVLGVRRQDGFAEVSTTSTRFGTNKCDTLTAYSGNAIPTVSFTSPYTGAGCPSGYSCKLVVIREGSLQSLTILLVDY